MQQRVHRRETSSSMVPPRRMGPHEMHTSQEDQTVGHRLRVPEVRMVHQSYVTGGRPHARSRNERRAKATTTKGKSRTKKEKKGLTQQEMGDESQPERESNSNRNLGLEHTTCQSSLPEKEQVLRSPENDRQERSGSDNVNKDERN